MKTAQEILRDHVKRLMDKAGVGEYQPLDEIEASEEYAACIEAMKEYARQACEEQKYICYETYDSSTGTLDQTGGAILNAPLPELK